MVEVTELNEGDEVATGTTGDHVPKSSSPKLLERRKTAHDEIEKVRRYYSTRFSIVSRFLHRYVLPHTNVSASGLSPSGVINMMLIAFGLLGVGAVYLGSRLAMVAIVPFVIYGAIWLLYPMVEPSEGAKKATEVMMKHPFLRQAQFEGCDVLFSLSRNASPVAKENLVNAGAIDCVLEAAFSFEHDSDIIARVLAIFGHLCPLEELCSNLIEDGMMELMSIWLQRHLLNESVCKHGLVLLAGFLSCPNESVSHKAKQRAIDCGMITQVLSVMEAHAKISRIQQWGCIVLSNLLDVQDSVDKLNKEGAIEQVTKALMNHPKSENVVRFAIGILSIALSQNTRNPNFEMIRDRLIDQKSPVFQLVEQAKINFPDTNEIQVGAGRIIKDCRQGFAS